MPLRHTRTTLAEIAAEAAVSVPTVSKVLNGRPDVARATRDRVESLLIQHGYVRRSVQSGPLRRHRYDQRRVVHFVSGQLEGAWASRVLAGAEEAAHRLGLELMVSVARDGGGTNDNRDWSGRLVQHDACGVILVLVELSEQHRRALEIANVPIVLIDPTAPPPSGTASVGATNWAGGYAAAEHLISLGHRRLAAIGGRPHQLYSQARLDGYRSALAASGLGLPRACLRHGDFSQQSGYAQMKALMELSESPTAVFVCSDHMAHGAYQALAERGQRIPDDVSVVGFDDLPEARWLSPPLTTIRQPLREMAAAAVGMLGRLMDGEHPESMRIELATDLVERASTAQFVPGKQEQVR